jgi:hypothetical protein
LISWFNRDFWGPVWPNLAASATVGLPAAYAVLRRARRHHTTTHDLLRQLHARLDGDDPEEDQ